MSPTSKRAKANASPKPDKSDKTAGIHKILRKAFGTKDTPIPTKSSEFNVKNFLTDAQLKDMFSKEAQALNVNDIDLQEALAEKPSQLLNSMELLKSLAAPPLRKNDIMVESDESDQDFGDDDDEEEEYVEFKFAPRPIYMATICQVCSTIFNEKTKRTPF